MKYAVPLLLAATSIITVESFVVVPNAGHGHQVVNKLSAQHNGETDLDSVRHEWQEEAAHIRAMEHSVFDDPSLEGMVEHKKKKPQKEYVQHEEHIHDSLWNEIEHALETDPDLTNVVAKKEAKNINNAFMEKEAHLHDSLLTEVEHAIDTDPYLSP